MAPNIFQHWISLSCQCLPEQKTCVNLGSCPDFTFLRGSQFCNISEVDCAELDENIHYRRLELMVLRQKKRTSWFGFLDVLKTVERAKYRLLSKAGGGVLEMSFLLQETKTRLSHLTNKKLLNVNINCNRSSFQHGCSTHLTEALREGCQSWTVQSGAWNSHEGGTLGEELCRDATDTGGREWVKCQNFKQIVLRCALFIFNPSHTWHPSSWNILAGLLSRDTAKDLG